MVVCVLCALHFNYHFLCIIPFFSRILDISSVLFLTLVNYAFLFESLLLLPEVCQFYSPLKIPVFFFIELLYYLLIFSFWFYLYYFLSPICFGFVVFCLILYFWGRSWKLWFETPSFLMYAFNAKFPSCTELFPTNSNILYFHFHSVQCIFKFPSKRLLIEE